MDEDLMFNLEDLDIKDEDLNIIDQPDGSDEPPAEIEKETEAAKDEEAAIIEEKDTKGKPPSSDTDDSSHSTLYTLAKHLKEEGVLYLDEDIEKVESLDDLKDLIRKSNDKARYVNLNDAQKRYQEALESGIPQKDYEQVEREIEAFENIKAEEIVTNENLRFEINTLDLMDKGLSQEKAMKLAKLSVKDESNVKDTQEALKGLLESKKAKFAELLKDSTKKTEVALDDIKQSINSKKELLEMPLNDITKNKLFDLMTTKVQTAEDGTPLNELQTWQKENPVEANIFLNYMFLMTNKGKDLGLIKKSSGSTAAKELEKKLKSMSFDKNGSLLIPDSMLKSVKPDQSRTVSTNDLTINI